MRALDAAEIVSVWELGSPRPPLERALLLLRAAAPGETLGDLAALPIGERDRRLVELRAATFGPALRFVARCPACDEEVAVALDASRILAEAGPAGPDAGTRELRVGDAVIRYRLPDTRDLAAAGGHPPEAAERLVLGRCVLEASVAAAPVRGEDLGPDLREALSRAMAGADPLAEVTLDVACPACEHRFPALLDPLAALWSDVDVEARRLLQEVDALARAYGWREGDVLALSPQRRALYLEMVTG